MVPLIGILECESRGRQTYFRVDERCLIIPELRSIFVKTVGIADAIGNALMVDASSILAAFIYGSFARGDVRSDSDVDLFIIGDITLRQLTSLFKNVNIGRVINPVVMTQEEFGSRMAQDDHFIVSVMKSPKLFLIGDEHGLSRPD